MATLKDENKLLKQVLEDTIKAEHYMRDECARLVREVDLLKRTIVATERMANDWRKRFFSEVGMVNDLHEEVARLEAANGEVA